VEDQQELEWLKKARDGDGDAFTYIVEQYQRPVYNLCYRMLGSVQDAEDAAQETFWRAFKALRRYDMNRPFITWILSIASHYCIDQHRKRKLPTLAMELLPEESIPFLAPTPEGTLIHSEEQSRVHRMLDYLKPQDRAAVILRYWYEMSEVEISEVLGISVGALKSRLHRARKKMALNWKQTQIQSLQVKEVV
jgi:RNA polymerase sigma-70 factor (ECF subfamily)